MNYLAEFTDTFSGELNYSWVRRASFYAPDNASTSLLIRRAKKALGIHGRHAILWDTPEGITARMVGECTAFTITPKGGDV